MLSFSSGTGETERNGTTTVPANRVIQGLWIGPELSAMEQLSIVSFLRCGHEYHLYVYEDVKGIPAGTVIKDGAEILPASLIFRYNDFASYAGFANFFRYKLLLERGGWWADTDVICLRPFDFPEQYVLSSELQSGAEVVNAGVMKVPIGSAVMGYAWEICQAKDPARLRWGETGPRLMAEAVRRFALETYVRSYRVFCPLRLPEWQRVLEPNAVWECEQTAHAIHLWNEAWRRTGWDKNGSYHPDCLYDRLRRKYL